MDLTHGQIPYQSDCTTTSPPHHAHQQIPQQPDHLYERHSTSQRHVPVISPSNRHPECGASDVVREKIMLPLVCRAPGDCCCEIPLAVMCSIVRSIVLFRFATPIHQLLRDIEEREEQHRRHQRDVRCGRKDGMVRIELRIDEINQAIIGQGRVESAEERETEGAFEIDAVHGNNVHPRGRRSRGLRLLRVLRLLREHIRDEVARERCQPGGEREEDVLSGAGFFGGGQCRAGAGVHTWRVFAVGEDPVVARLKVLLARLAVVLARFLVIDAVA